MSKLIALIAIELVMLFSNNIFGQIKISGRVTDSAYQIVEYATIELSRDSIHVLKSFSDSTGNYSLTNIRPGSYRLVSSYLGNRQYELNFILTRDTTIDIRFAASTSKDLQAITVKAKVIERVGDKLYFNVENSIISKGFNGIDVLQRSPKLNVSTDGGIMLNNRAATVLINGRKTSLAGAELNSYLSSLNSEDIKRIEIQEMASAELDATSAGGVINIVSKKIPNGFRAIAKTSYLFRKEEYGTYNGSLGLNYSAAKWTMYSNLNYSRNRDLGRSTSAFNYNTGVKNTYLEKFDADDNDLSWRTGLLLYPDKRNELGIEGYVNNNKAVYDGYGNQQLTRHNSTDVNSKIHSVSAFKNRLWYITLNYTYKTDGQGSTLKFIGDVGRNKSLPSNNVETNYPDDPERSSYYTYNTTALSDYYTLQADWIQKIGSNTELQSGLKYGNVKRNNELTPKFLKDDHWIIDEGQRQDFDNRENIIAGYLSAGKQWNKHYVKAGLRVENTDIKGLNRINSKNVKQNYTRLFPSLYYKYDLKEDRSLSASYKRSITRPSFADLNPYVVKQNDYLYLTGNPYLQPLYMDMAELGLDYPNQSISVFGRKTTNTIQGAYYTDSALVNYFQPQNFGKFYETGIDYYYNRDITKWLYASVSTGIFYNSFKDIAGISTSGTSFYNNIYIQLNPVPTWTVELFNNYQHRYKNKNLSGEPKYKTDVSIRKSFKQNIILSFRANDIFNTRIDENLSFYKDFTSYYRLKRLTRSFIISIQYTFDNKKKINTRTIKSDNETRQRL
ncbi:TonB-dependent receptor [Chitinophaga tropicalis]|uniref:TonB-dependent receptor n=1 Tax=Chitinophaga tropicalis TaxID=2683588 RepID=A0A7K1UE90_9BACT|nr:TonB-dependent receptor [Chitinophaga tropicalis]MVT12295.1 TonB-dependent receptor [Chitinophaga tropicalis]